MFQRLATQIQEQLNALVDQYDARLRTVPGYANLPQAARRDLEQHVLQLIADCLKANDDSRLIQYIRERAEQVLTHGFQPEWFQQAVTIPQDIITPLIKTVAESNFVWHALVQAQTAAWEIVAQERRRAEQTLRESEARYQTIFDATPVMFWLKDTHNRTLRINRAAAELEGVKPADVEGKSAYDLYPHEQAEAFYQDDLEVIRSNQPKVGIAEQHTSVGTGKLMWLETGKTPVHNDQGETVGVLAFAVDVTERKQAEEVLRRGAQQQQQTSQHLRAALEAASELIQVQDLDTLYRRTVELAREKFEIERCGLYMVDESRGQMRGTYGTDDQQQTTDERGSQRTAAEFAEILTASPKQLWVVRETPHIFVKEGKQHTVGIGWVAGTVLRGATGPIGILFNDSALSGRPVDEAQQEALAIYCSIIGSIIERKRVEEQVRESYARRGIQVQTSTEIAQEIASATDLNELFKRVVTLIKERFDYYHAQVFRYEPDQDVVVLITGYGETGQKMLEAGHKLQMGRGVVGTAAATGQSILASDVRQDADWRPNPHLPDTSGELAVPIMWRDQVLGILDVQSDQVNALTDDDRLLLEGLCGQIAIAMESTRLLESVQQSELDLRKFKLGLDRSTAAIFITDANGVITYVNPGFEKVYGYTREEAVGQTPRIIKSGLIPQEQYKHFWGTLLAGQTVAGEIINKAKDGRLVPVQGSNSAIEDEQGNILGFLALHSDITERKQAEEALRRNEAQLSEALKIAQLGYWEYDVEKDLFHFNDQFYSIFHTTAEQAGSYQLSSAQYAQQFVHPDDLPLVGTEIEKALNSTDRHYNRQLEHRVLYADGGVGYISVNINIERDEHGHILRYYGANQDITQSKLAEQAIREEQQRTQTILETITVPMIISRLSDSKVLYANQALAQFRHMDLNQLIGSRTTDYFVEQDDRNRLIESLRHQGYATDFETQLRGSGGVVSWVLLSARIIDFQNETCVLSTYVDITARKQIEEVLRRNEAQLSEALKIAKLGYWEYDVEKDLFHFNDQFYSIFHTTAEQAGGYQLSSARYAQQFVHPDDLPLVGTEIEKALNSTDRHYSRDLEHRILYADGGVGYISVNINIERDEHGHILRYYGANQDITQSKLAEQEFSRFKQGLEQASDAVFMTDIDGHFIYVNPAFERIYGYSSAEVLGQTPRILKSGQLSQKFYQHFWQTLLNRQSISGEKPNKTKDGRVIIIEDSNSPILDSHDNLLGFLSTHRDITERKQAEQRMAETLRETERLYAAVGHEDWQTYRQTGQLGEGYLFDQALIQPADNVWEPEIAQALEQHALITSRSGQRAVAVSPLAVRGETIGALGVYDDPAHPLSKEDLQLIEAVSEQIALSLESARLFDQNQRDAEREHTINRVTSRIRNARSVDEVLSIAAQELRLATQASRSVVEILPATDQPVGAGNGEGVKA